MHFNSAPRAERVLGAILYKYILYGEKKGKELKEIIMKLLVLSDSHGYDAKLADIILEHRDADAIIFLGDGAWDFENAVNACNVGPDKIICQVRGNCDRASMEPDKLVREFGNIRFFITHGHEQNVKLGIWRLVEEAKKQKCTVALYGHTHCKSCMVKEGITLINPGSVSGGNCCVVEFADGKVKVN